jgi:hypothetical protein
MKVIFGRPVIFTFFGFVLLTLPSGVLGQTATTRQNQILTAFFNAERGLLQANVALQPVEVDKVAAATSFFTASKRVGFPKAAVVRSIESNKAQLITDLEGEELAGLRAYVRVKYPPATELVVFRSPTFGSELVEPYSKEDVVSKALGFISDTRAKLTNSQRRGKETINLDCKSEPTEAKFELVAEGGTVREGTSDSTLSNVYRGLYTYKVTKAGYKTIQEHLIDLVNEDGTSLECRLHRDDTTDGPYPCSLRKSP